MANNNGGSLLGAVDSPLLCAVFYLETVVCPRLSKFIIF